MGKIYYSRVNAVLHLLSSRIVYEIIKEISEDPVGDGDFYVVDVAYIHPISFELQVTLSSKNNGETREECFSLH